MLELRQIKPGLMQQSFAGDTFNSAVYMKRSFAELDVSFMTAVGKDAVSEQLIAACENESLDVKHLHAKSDRNPGVYMVQTDEHGERSFLYWRDMSAAKQVMQYVDEEAMAGLRELDLFFFSGISIAILPAEDRDRFWEMLAELKQAGVKVVFDPNYRARLWSSLEEAQVDTKMAMALSDIVLPGIEDCEALFGINSVDALIEFCKPFELEELVIKNGPNSVTVVTPEQIEEVAVTPVKNVVDTTSAGDSFNGTYLGARLTGASAEAAVNLASAAAGYVIQHPGAIVPSQGFQEFIQNHK